MRLYKKTSKLFFDRYVNKIVLVNPLSYEFREKNLYKVLKELQVFSQRIQESPTKAIQVNSWNRKIVYEENIFHAISLCNLLIEESDNFTVRVEGSNLGVYSNNDSTISKIEELGSIKEVSKPATDKIKNFLLSTPNSIISKKYTHKFRVTVNPLREYCDDFHTWAEKIPSIKLLKRTYRSEGYFYAANEKALGMCRLFLGKKIRRVDTMYLESEI